MLKEMTLNLELEWKKAGQLRRAGMIILGVVLLLLFILAFTVSVIDPNVMSANNQLGCVMVLITFGVIGIMAHRLGG